MDPEDKTKLATGCCCAGFVAIVIVLLGSFGSVGDTEVAVAYDSVWNNLDPAEVTPGFKTKPVFGEFIRWPTIYTQLEYSEESSAGGRCSASDDSCGSILCNSRDGLNIDLNVNLQFKPMRSKIFDLTILYKDFESYKGVVELSIRSACRHACANFTAISFQQERSKVQSVMKEEVDRLLDPLHTIVLDLQLTSVERPQRYETEVKAQQEAQQDIDLAMRQRAQILTQANTIKESNLVQANLTVQTAQIEAASQAAFATARAAGLTSQFGAYATTYAAVMTSQNLTVKGLLAYIGNRIIYAAKDVNLNLKAPSEFGPHTA